MSASTFRLSYPAQAQLLLLTNADKTALDGLFATDPLQRPDVTKAMSDGRFVSRIGKKLILWRKANDDQPEIISIVDRSFLPEAG
jgi:hypothetical protein